MRKNFIFRFLPLIAMAVSLQSCRTNEDYLSGNEKPSYSNKFQVFSVANKESVNYAQGFRTLLENYDQINGTGYSRAALLKKGSFNKNESEYVEFNLHSQEMLLDDGERWVIYPIIKSNQVDGLMAGILRNEETEVEFRKLDSGHAYYDEVYKIFSIAYTKNKLKHGLNSKNGCGFEEDDACGIPDIIISPPPKPRPTGGGPKGGCTGYNNCFDPSVGSGGGGGSNTPTPEAPQNPCEKTKALLENQEVNDVVADLKNHMASGIGGEKGWKLNKNGPPTQTTENGPHSVVIGDPSLLNGAYHNHTGTKVDIFSATDVDTLLEIARYQNIGNTGNAFSGMVAPNGIHYVIHFNGRHSDLPASGAFSEVDLEVLKISQYRNQIKLLSDTSGIYCNSQTGKLNSKGLEKLFMNTLKAMGLENKIILQRIDDDGIKTIKQNIDGTLNPVPCI
ncbi:hypothetical protein [Chryseobacterium sp. W4I1]|uniref:hypothetical protein n=1 Tax=Chryseobacterium sp. W4I1 TaxID=3042293 RepID=UPI00278B75D9|nr:hypothetical protein [Chryseobacterium sp. W4I1]MDQ0780206.1 hypothetical protein [Chryseobacterium sp. W4I1]